MTDPVTCPFLKEVVMMYCDACPVKKMVPRDHLVTTRPCLAENYEQCSLYREAVERSSFSEEPSPADGSRGASGAAGKEVPS
jgi:hypothetical protein